MAEGTYLRREWGNSKKIGRFHNGLYGDSVISNDQLPFH